MNLICFGIELKFGTALKLTYNIPDKKFKTSSNSKATCSQASYLRKKEKKKKKTKLVFAPFLIYSKKTRNRVENLHTQRNVTQKYPDLSCNNQLPLVVIVLQQGGG